jgi:hypothetical protein
MRSQAARTRSPALIYSQWQPEMPLLWFVYHIPQSACITQIVSTACGVIVYDNWCVQAGGPSYAVELGRLDGLSSTAASVNGKLPAPTFTLTQLNTLFAANGLSQNDMVALSGRTTVLINYLVTKFDGMVGICYTYILSKFYFLK